MVHLRFSALLAAALFLSAADPHASGQAASVVRSARTASLPAFTTAAFAVCVPFSPSITGPHASGRIIACAHCSHTAPLCKHSFRWPGGCSLILRLINHPACSIRSPYPFCVHARSLSRYVRSCFARQLLRSLHSHSSAILMANASLRSSGVCRK